MPSLDRSSTVAQIVAEHSAAARVFQKHEIDFCCHGNVTVAEACRGRALDPAAVFAELEATLPAGGTPAADDARNLPVPALVARIVDRHHGYLRQALPFIAPLAQKVAGVHGPHNPKLRGVSQTFRELSETLLPHLDEEERLLFPALMAPAPDAEVVRGGLDRMYDEHVAVGAMLGRLREQSDAFTTPEWGCNSYRLLMSELEALEGDILRHVHLENHVLMPRFAPAPGGR